MHELDVILQVQDGYGIWARCFGSVADQSDSQPVEKGLCGLPSYRFFFYINSATSVLTAALTSSISLYFIFIMFSDVLGEMETYKTFVIGFISVVILFIVVAVKALNDFVVSVRISNAVLSPRWNAEYLADEYYYGLFYSFFLPPILMVVLSLFFAIMLQWRIRIRLKRKFGKENGQLAYYKTSLDEKGFLDLKVLKFLASHPDIFDAYLKEEGFSSPTLRALLIRLLSEKIK